MNTPPVQTRKRSRSSPVSGNSVSSHYPVHEPGTPYRWESSTPTPTHTINRMQSMLAKQLTANALPRKQKQTFRVPNLEEFSASVRKKTRGGNNRGGNNKRKRNTNNTKSKKRSALAFMEPAPEPSSIDHLSINESDDLLGFKDTPTSIHSVISDAGMESFPVSPVDDIQTTNNPFSPSSEPLPKEDTIPGSMSGSVPMSKPVAVNNGFGQYYDTYIPRSMYEMEQHVHVRPIQFLSASWNTMVKQVYSKNIGKYNNLIMSLGFTIALQILTFVPHTAIYPKQKVNKSEWETFVLFVSIKMAIKFDDVYYEVNMTPQERMLEEYVMLNTKINPMNPTVYTFVEILMPPDTPALRKELIYRKSAQLSAIAELYKGNGKPSHIAKAILNNMANTNFPVEPTLQSKVIGLTYI